MRNFQQLPGKNAIIKIIRGKFGGNTVSKAKAYEREVKLYDFMERRRLLRREGIAAVAMQTVRAELEPEGAVPSFHELHLPVLPELKPYLAKSQAGDCGVTFVLRDVPFAWMDRYCPSDNQGVQKVNFVANEYGGDDFQICIGADGRIQSFHMDEDLW